MILFPIIGTVLLCCCLSSAVPFPFPGEPIATPIPVAPTYFPFGPNTKPFAPGFNNTYYNHPGGAAVPIVSYSSEHGVDGTYAFSFSTADGKQAQESGYLKDAYIDNSGNPQGTQVVQGSFAYVSPDGTPIEVSYVADENGFRPSGVHIPANGKAAIPLLDKDRKQIVDPAFNRYNPYLNRNGYDYLGQYNNRVYDGQYNRGYDRLYNRAYESQYNQPYDARYNPRAYNRPNPYDPSKFHPYNNYNPYQIRTQPKITQELAKKPAA